MINLLFALLFFFRKNSIKCYTNSNKNLLDKLNFMDKFTKFKKSHEFKRSDVNNRIIMSYFKLYWKSNDTSIVGYRKNLL